MRVYVGGKLGDTPLCVMTTVEQVMVALVQFYLIAGPEPEHAYDEQWSCALIGGEPGNLRCDLTVEADTSDPVHLYIESYEVDQA